MLFGLSWGSQSIWKTGTVEIQGTDVLKTKQAGSLMCQINQTQTLYISANFYFVITFI